MFYLLASALILFGAYMTFLLVLEASNDWDATIKFLAIFALIVGAILLIRFTLDKMSEIHEYLLNNLPSSPAAAYKAILDTVEIGFYACGAIFLYEHFQENEGSILGFAVVGCIFIFEKYKAYLNEN